MHNIENSQMSFTGGSGHHTGPRHLLESLRLVQPVHHLERLRVLGLGWKAQLCHSLGHGLISLQGPAAGGTGVSADASMSLPCSVKCQSVLVTMRYAVPSACNGRCLMLDTANTPVQATDVSHLAMQYVQQPAAIRQWEED